MYKSKWKVDREEEWYKKFMYELKTWTIVAVVVAIWAFIVWTFLTTFKYN
jgi:nitrate reductase NapE component